METKVDHVRTQLTVQSADAEAARNLANFLQQTSAPLQAFLTEFAKQVPAKDATVPQLPEPKVEGDRLTWTFDEQFTAAAQQVVAKAVVAGRADLHRHQSMNNLKEIGIAMHNYLDIYHQFPDRAIRDKVGKPLLSWRVAILPFIDQNGLYKEFHLDEPWDSEHNRQLIDRIPNEYCSPDAGDQRLGRTRYLVPVGENLMFPPDRGIKFTDITDGSSLTLMVVEVDADHSVIWTKPDDLEVDLENPANGLAAKDSLFNALFADASVNGISGSIDPKVLKALFTRNGGERVNLNDLQTNH